MKISRILDNTRDRFPSVLPLSYIYFIIIIIIISEPIVRSATHSQQPPERSVLSHAASTWRGLLTTADDRQWLKAVISRGIRSGFCSTDRSPLSELVEAADDHLFSNILCNKEHVLNSVLPSSIQLIYELRPTSTSDTDTR